MSVISRLRLSIIGSILVSLILCQPSEAQQGDAAIMSYLQQATAVLALDEQCDVLSQEARLTARSVRARIHQLAASAGLASITKVQEATESIREAALKEFQQGCTGYLKNEKFQTLVNTWNNVGRSQISILANPDIQIVCKFNTEDYRLLREEASQALEELKSVPESQWKPGLDKRIGYYKRRCQSGASFEAPDRNVVEVAEELAMEFKKLQDLNAGSEKAAPFRKIYGLRGSTDGHQVFLKTDHNTHPSEIMITGAGSLVVKPLTDDLGTVSIGYDRTDAFRNLQVGDDGLWRLQPSEFNALMSEARSIHRPSIVIVAESWADLSTPVYLARIDPETLGRALSYSQAPKP